MESAKPTEEERPVVEAVVECPDKETFMRAADAIVEAYNNSFAKQTEEEQIHVTAAVEKVTEFPEVSDQQVMAHEEGLLEVHDKSLKQYAELAKHVDEEQCHSEQVVVAAEKVTEMLTHARDFHEAYNNALKEYAAGVLEHVTKKQCTAGSYPDEIPQATRDWVSELKRLQYNICLHIDSAPADGDNEMLSSAKVHFLEGRFDAVYAVTEGRKVM